MKKKLQLLVLAFLAVQTAHAQAPAGSTAADSLDVAMTSEFSFNESQLDEDEDVNNEVIQVGSATNVYTSQIGYTWGGSMRFRFRALDSRFNDVYMNGVQVNNAENGRFSYSTIGGMNDAVRNKDNSNPFEANTFSMSGIGGSANYNLRAAAQPTGHKVTLSGARRNYTLRGMYSYGSGLNEHGWAFFTTLGYRWANMETAIVDGTFYNSFSYFMAVQKQWSEGRSLNFAAWGSPTERAAQGPTVDEARWLANDYQYNPYWGFQNGQKRSSRVINNFEPSFLATLDWKFNDKVKMTLNAFVKYAKYSSTNLNYNDAQNPAPDYWKNMPSSKYNPWPEGHQQNNEYSLDEFYAAQQRWSTVAGRQINWDELYAKNRGRNDEGKDAAYYVGKRHNDHLTTNLSATFNAILSRDSKLDWGLQIGRNKGMHYQTIDDLMGAYYLYNVNSYAIGKFTVNDPQVWYDYSKHEPGDNSPYTTANRLREGDRYGYDYSIISENLKGWASISTNKGPAHMFLSAFMSGTRMYREGYMQNGIYLDNSKGRSGVAKFLDGGVKAGATINLGKGHAITFGAGYEADAPKASVAFLAPEMNNNYATNMVDKNGNVYNLRNEKRLSAEFGYVLNNSWLRLNLNGYYYHMYHGTEHSNFFDDELNSFTYNTLTNIEKRYYGVELGAKFKVTSNFDIVMLGTYSEAEYANDALYHWERSIPSVIVKEDANDLTCFSKGMHEGGTPLTAASLGLNYRVKGWFLNLTGNYYDRIYMSFAPNQRLDIKYADRDEAPAQAEGHGGFMLDASIGRQFRIGKNPLSVNLQLCNLNNARDITTGGFEQSRGNTPKTSSGGDGNKRIYDFSKNPRKFYAQGFNFMLNLNYRF